MPLVHAIVLGIIQGLTEFLPISSSAHLVLIPYLLGWPEHPLSFDIALHAGTLVAVLLYFFRDWIQVLAQGFGMSATGDPALSRNRRLLWMLVAATIPVGVAGLLLQKKAETTWRNPDVIGGMLILVGLFMWWADRSGRRQKDLGNVTMEDALTIGVAQALAVVPGTSRSGVTISAGLFRNLDRTAAARFSFLLSTPAIGGAAAKDFWDLMRHEGGIPPEMRTAFIVGIVASGIVGALSIRFFLTYLRRRSLAFFVYYRVIFGIMVIALAHFFRFGGK